MNREEIKKVIFIIGGFLILFFLPINLPVFREAIFSGIDLLHNYARNHVLASLLPAFLIAGAIAAFIKKEQVLKYLGGGVKKYISYSIASLSGAVLTVCSCTILPLFAGIRKNGAGLGPAIAFLFAGPAINIVAILLTFSVLGIEIALARLVFAFVLAIAIGISMQIIFKEKSKEINLVKEEKGENISKGLVFFFILLLLSIIVVNGLNIDILLKGVIFIFLLLSIFIITLFGFKKDDLQKWIKESWGFIKTLAPVLFIGIFVAGFVMPLLPPETISGLVGSNTVLANLIAAFFGIFMYFSTLTEVPILDVLMERGMSSGPALALLLAGPSLSLPNLLVIRSILGNKKTLVYAVIAGLYSAIAGLIFGAFM